MANDVTSDETETSESETSESEGFRQFRFTPPSGSTRLLLIRHGESAPAVPGKPFPLTDGHGDPPLHSHGLEQAERVGERLHRAGIDAIYVTTLVRTHQTAAPLAERLQMTPRVEPDLREVHLGDWEGGLLRQKAAEQDPVFVAAFTEERWDVIPGAEPLDDFNSRIQGALARISGRHADQTVAAVVHGGVIGQIFAHATGRAGFAFAEADNGSISELFVGEGIVRIRRFNDTAHLEGLET